ncbi:MAG: co-chaperone GroES [Calditrichaeota bacterium]|nr:MAG: co-chaperone GroES [Calditrichota bacterium]
MSIEPLQDHVLAQIIQARENTGTIILPETAQQNPVKARVVAVGPGRVTENGTRLPMDIQKGDTVIFENSIGTEIKENKDSYILIKQTDILAKVNN